MRYVVRYEWHGDGVWFVQIPSLKGVYTQARTLRQGRKYILEVLELMVSKKAAKAAALVDDVRLPRGLGHSVKANRKLQRAASQRASRLKQALESVKLRKQDLYELLRH